MVGEDGSGQLLAVPLPCLLILVVLSSGLSSNILQVRRDRHNIFHNAETADPDTEHHCWLPFRRPASSLSQTLMHLIGSRHSLADDARPRGRLVDIEPERCIWSAIIGPLSNFALNVPALYNTTHDITMGSIEQPPQYRRAIVVDPADSTHSIRDNVPLPAPQPDEFIIRTDAIAINPSDLKMRGPFVVPDGILGIDCAGTVVSVGSNVAYLKPGDRVCGPQHSMHAHSPHYGAYTDYVVCSGKVWMNVPENISIEGAASLGASISTAGLGIKLLGLPLPDTPISHEKKVYVLVYGGATATGTLAIQLLKL